MNNLFPLLTQYEGFLILGFYTLLALFFTNIFSKGFNNTKDGFIVANRNLGTFQGTMSISAAWIWAPAMFISCLQGYVNGYSAVFWMVLGNFFSIVLFGYLTPKIRERFPNGFTLSGLMRDTYSPRVQFIFVIEMLMLTLGALSVNMLAGSMAISTITGINFTVISILIPCIALSYALKGGLKASVVTEIIKVFVFMTVWLGLCFWAVNVNGGFDVVMLGFGGKTGQGTTLFGNDFAINAFISFGIPTIVSLMSGTWADNTFYQRTFAIQKDSVRKSFFLASPMNPIITILGAMIGMLAAGMHLDIPKALQTYTNIVVFGSSLPTWVFPVLMFVIFASLVSIIDSQLGTASALAGNDFYNLMNKSLDNSKVLVYSRAAMVIVALLAILIVNIPGITLLQIFLIYGLSRTTVWLPVMVTVLNDKLLSERGMFWGVLLSWMFGLPIYIYGDLFNGGNFYKLTGTLITVFFGIIVGYFVSILERKK
jgi:Na+/proline symporter